VERWWHRALSGAAIADIRAIDGLFRRGGPEHDPPMTNDTTYPLFQIDAFTDRLFSGNPAAVVLLPAWLPDATLQAIAAENNLSETAYVVRKKETFGLRWFTPTVEVDLCGHATLASAFVLFEEREVNGPQVVFESRSGLLKVERRGELLAMDFPSRPPKPTVSIPTLARTLGIEPREVLSAHNLFVVLENRRDVEDLRPDLDAIAALDAPAVIVTAPGDDCDFVSRFFAPKAGIPEDPVTGSAHCTLTPYWSARLGKKTLHARQVSSRGGELFCEDRGDRVTIAGRAVLYLKGEMRIAFEPR
jgi:PhzF family phenazine biosynthesis protein